MDKKRLVITGLGFFSYQGFEKDTLWEEIEASNVEPQNYEKVEDKALGSFKAYEMAGHFDPNDYIENRKLKRLADFSKILCVASKNALTDAGISKDMEGYQPEKIGSIVNTVHGPMNVTFDYLDDLLTTGPATARPILFQQTVNNVACGQVAIENQLKGVSSTIIGASSLEYAANLLRKGTADAILVAGHEELHPYIFAAYASKNMLATDKGAGERSIPYAKEANGLVLGEGSGVLILETYESATRRNAHIYAELVDEIVVTDENYCKTYDEFKDNSTGFYRAMNTVLSKNQVAPEQVDFISIAGNSYKATDAIEQVAIERIFKDTSRMGYVASKAIFGETLGASEVLAVISALLCMEHGKVPGLSYLEEKHSADKADCCIVNSLFTGGNINSVLLKKVQEA